MVSSVNPIKAIADKADPVGSQSSKSRRFNILRAFLRGKAATRPSAPNGESPLTEAAIKDTLSSEPLLAEVIAATAPRTTPFQIVLILLGMIAFFYFARPVVLPVFLACVAGMTLKPLIRWLSCCHIPPAISAAVVLYQWSVKNLGK